MKKIFYRGKFSFSSLPKKSQFSLLSSLKSSRPEVANFSLNPQKRPSRPKNIENLSNNALQKILKNKIHQFEVTKQPSVKIEAKEAIEKLLISFKKKFNDEENNINELFLLLDVTFPEEILKEKSVLISDIHEIYFQTLMIKEKNTKSIKNNLYLKPLRTVNQMFEIEEEIEKEKLQISSENDFVLDNWIYTMNFTLLNSYLAFLTEKFFKSGSFNRNHVKEILNFMACTKVKNDFLMDVLIQQTVKKYKSMPLATIVEIMRINSKSKKFRPYELIYRIKDKIESDIKYLDLPTLISLMNILAKNNVYNFEKIYRKAYRRFKRKDNIGKLTNKDLIGLMYMLTKAHFQDTKLILKVLDRVKRVMFTFNLLELKILVISLNGMKQFPGEFVQEMLKRIDFDEIIDGKLAEMGSGEDYEDFEDNDKDVKEVFDERNLVYFKNVIYYLKEKLRREMEKSTLNETRED